MAFIAARMLVSRGRPPGRAGGISGSQPRPLRVPQIARIPVALAPVNPTVLPPGSGVRRQRPIWAELHMALRERMGREASPSAAVLDSQSVKSAEKGAVKTT